MFNDRKCKQNAIDNGCKIDFLKETEYVRNSEWKIAKIPHDLLDRRVEITGPVDRKMIIESQYESQGKSNLTQMYSLENKISVFFLCTRPPKLYT